MISIVIIIRLYITTTWYRQNSIKLAASWKIFEKDQKVIRGQDGVFIVLEFSTRSDYPKCSHPGENGSGITKLYPLVRPDISHTLVTFSTIYVHAHGVWYTKCVKQERSKDHKEKRYLESPDSG